MMSDEVGVTEDLISPEMLGYRLQGCHGLYRARRKYHGDREECDDQAIHLPHYSTRIYNE